MRVVIFGSRELPDPDLAKSYIDKALELSGWHVTEVVSGTARGADTIGEDWAAEHGIPVKRFPADWDRYGKSAGFRRNADMADYADCGIALWDGLSRGTQNTILHLQNRDKPYALATFHATGDSHLVLIEPSPSDGD